MDIDPISLTTTIIELYKNMVCVATGSGFLYGRDAGGGRGYLSLVTNIHVLTGHPPGSENEPIGDMIRFYLHVDNKSVSNVRWITAPLFTKQGKPTWIQSNRWPMADIAVLPIPGHIYHGCNITCMSKGWCGPEVKLRPTGPVSLVGYPHGLYDKQNMVPVYKTGSFASEPELDYNGHPVILVDVSAFPGMSGAPAVSCVFGAYESADGRSKVGKCRQLIGVYASMTMLSAKKYLEELHNDKTKYGIAITESMQLGHIWRVGIVDSLINGVDFEGWANMMRQD